MSFNLGILSVDKKGATRLVLTLSEVAGFEEKALGRGRWKSRLAKSESLINLGSRDGLDFMGLAAHRVG